MLRSATDVRAPFDDDLAERDTPLVELRQKISGCLRTGAGAEAFRAALPQVRSTG